jgi:hypothetical protein
MVLPANSLRFSIVTDSGLPRTETKCFIYATTFSAGLRAVRIHAQTLPRVPIYDYEDPEPAAIGQSVTHKVHTPPLVRPGRTCKRDRHLRRRFGTPRGAWVSTYRLSQIAGYVPLGYSAHFPADYEKTA